MFSKILEMVELWPQTNHGCSILANSISSVANSNRLISWMMDFCLDFVLIEPVWGPGGSGLLAALFTRHYTISGLSCWDWIGFVPWCCTNNTRPIFRDHMTLTSLNITIISQHYFHAPLDNLDIFVSYESSLPEFIHIAQCWYYLLCMFHVFRAVRSVCVLMEQTGGERLLMC